MGFSHNHGQNAPGMTANSQTMHEWSFHGNPAYEINYEGNFEDDIDALSGGSVGDSGYYSNENDVGSYEDNTDTSAEIVNSKNDLFSCELEPKTAERIHADILYADAAASTQSNYGSIYDGTKNNSTPHLLKGTSHGKQAKVTRRSKTVDQAIHDYDNPPLHKFTSITDEKSSPLEKWVRKSEHHELLAYRLEQPLNLSSAKRRRTNSKQ